MEKITKRIVWEMTANITLGITYLYFARTHLNAFLAGWNFSSLFYLIFMSMGAFFFFIRKFPTTVCPSIVSWIVGISGTFILLLYKPVPGPEYYGIWALQTVGLTLQIWALFSLNRSFGVIAANRGLKTGGMYAFVRHPLYSSYLVSNTALIANNISNYNLAIYLSWLVLQVFRIVKEEQLLATNEEYKEYLNRVRWRLIPYIF